MVSDKTIHKAFRIHKTQFLNKTQIQLLFYYLPKLYIVFKANG